MSRLISYLIFFFGGATALSWQVLWQLDLSLSLGVSAKGTALTVATVMAGLTLGARFMAKRIESAPPRNPWRLYGALELSVGLLGILARILQPFIEWIDTAVFNILPFAATPTTLIMLCLVIGPSAGLMGATLPVIGVISERSRHSFSRFYAVNTAGAGAGCLLVTFLLLPMLGRFPSALVVIGIQACVFVATFRMRAEPVPVIPVRGRRSEKVENPIPIGQAVLLATITGVVTFILEVSWFRLLRASWLSTTDSFAVMLFVFLTALAIGAWMSRRARLARIPIWGIFLVGAVLIWGATPVLERFDLWGTAGGSYRRRIFIRVLAALATMGPPVAVIGMVLPWLLDESRRPRAWARIYGWNTIGAVIGSLLAGWILLGMVGPVWTSWIAGGILAGASLILTKTRKARIVVALVAIIAAGIGISARSGIGTYRIQGPTAMLRKGHLLVAHHNGPDATTSVVKVGGGANVLFIDGYAATGEFGAFTAYMDAMGRLPMLLHSNPKSALVICFGTGQTTNAVRQENAEQITVVDVNPAVYALAKFFPTNQNVLDDKRVRHLVMDGRAWLRRSPDQYDVVTLEPMPPFFAGSNSLYSVEFYELIAGKLREDGFVAQWFPLHLLSPEQARGVAAAFCRVFPNSLLWIDPSNQNGMQGILLGRKGDRTWEHWPGMDRGTDFPRPLSKTQIEQSIFLNTGELSAFVAGATPVSDENQMLSYGNGGIHRADLGKHNFTDENMAVFRELKRRLEKSGVSK